MSILKINKLTLNFSDIKKMLGLSLTASLLVSSLYVLAEPALSIAASSDVKSVVVTLSVGEGITLSVDSGTTAMTPISITQNTGVATSTFTVATNAVAGYKLEVNASSTAPAMQTSTGVGIPDATTTPTLIASIPASGTYAFGFSAYGANVPTGTWGTTSTGCAESASSTPSASLKWRGFAGATKIQIATLNSTTTTSGVPSTICFFAKQNGSYIPSGNYTATITATATTL